MFNAIKEESAKVNLKWIISKT